MQKRGGSSVTVEDLEEETRESQSDSREDYGKLQSYLVSS